MISSACAVWPSRLVPPSLLLNILLLFAPLSVLANEVHGRVNVRGASGQVLPSAGTDAVPLKDVTVILGVLERNPQWEPLGLFEKIATTRTDDNGEYSFYIQDDPDPSVPNVVVDYALIVILDSPAVATYDQQAAANDDPDKPACLASAAFGIPIRGIYQADFNLLADGGGSGADVGSSFSVMNNGFDPLLDLDTDSLFGVRPDCDEIKFDGPLAPHDVRGFSNVEPERFAHLAILQARAYDASEFLRFGLTVPVLTPVEVRAWNDFPSMAYQCSTHEILVDPSSSDFFGTDKDSRLFAMRHEFGHHFVCGSEIAGLNQPVPLPAGDTGHGGLKNSTSAGAWAEGFATYFAGAVSEFKGEPTPYIQSTKAGQIDMSKDLIVLDNPLAGGEQRPFGTLGEEFAVANLLWRASELTGTDALISTLDASGIYLVDFAEVYTTMRLDGAINSVFPVQCYFNDLLESVAAGVDCLFIEHGFYHDGNGDGLYTDASEFLAAHTRWPLTGPYARAESDVRSSVPIIEGSMLKLSAVDSTGQPVSLDRFDIQIQYDAPHDSASFDYTKEISGDGPYEFPILIPARPSRAIITAIKDDLTFAGPVTIESDFYHQRIDAYRDVAVEPILLEHVFGATEPPDPLIFKDGFE